MIASFFPIVGVDIGGRTIKGVKLKKKGGKVSVDRFFFYDLALSNQKYPKEADSEEKLKAVIEMSRLKSTRAASCIPDQDIWTSEFELPQMSKKEIKAAVRHQVEEHVHFPMSEAVFDYMIVNPGDLEEGESLKVKVFWAKKFSVLKQVETLSGASLKPVSVESAMLANIETLKFNGDLQEGSHYALVDLGESRTSIAFTGDNYLKLSKTIPIGLGEINRRFQESLNLPYALAEEKKVEYDFGSLMGEGESENKLIDDVYFQIFKEIKEAIEYFQEHSGKICEVEKIFLIGGGSNKKSIQSVFESFYNVETSIVNPFKNVDIYSAKDAPADQELGKLGSYMTTAMGLALRGVKG